MNQKLQNILISSVALPAGLEGRVTIEIKRAARQNFLERVTIGSVISALFAVALVIVGRDVFAEAITSGFGQYASLVFSNSGSVLSDWRDFAWTMVESAPVTGSAIFLGTAGMFIAAVRWTGKTFGKLNGIMGRLAV